MILFLVVKLLLVVFFLVMFLRRPTLIWGIGLLTVTTALLLDTFLGTFGQEEMVAELGFFFYVISGALFAGAAIWLWGVLRPLATTAVPPTPPLQTIQDVSSPAHLPEAASSSDQAEAAFDRQMLYDEIRQRFGREDVLDLMFDLGINENDVMTLDQNMNQLIINVMDLAQQQGQNAALALAVERILTPPPPENLPRPEKIKADSPPTILRHYLLAHYDLAQLENVCTALELDWEQLGAGSKKAKVRSLLLYFYRRNRIDELVTYLHDTGPATAVSTASQTHSQEPHQP